MGIEDLYIREEELKKEIAEFNQEKERIKQLIGGIGGASYSKKDTIINIVFLTIIVLGFAIEMTTHIVPTAVSLEIGVLLVSIKIVFMIHSQQKSNHFTFWILNSIEFRINDIAKKVKCIERKLKELEKTDEQTD